MHGATHSGEIEHEDQHAGRRKGLRKHTREDDHKAGSGRGGNDDGKLWGNDGAKDEGRGSAEERDGHGDKPRTIRPAVVDKERVEGA